MDRPELTKELLEELYITKRMNFRAIGALLGYDGSWVRRKVLQLGIPVRKKPVDVSKKKLVEMYVGKQLSQREIASALGRSQCYVRSKLSEYGIVSRDSGTAQVMKRGIPFNDTFFDNWSREMAYVLGFIYADGCLHKNRLTIEVAERDIQIIHTICDLLDYPYTHIYRKYCKQYDSYSVGIHPSRRDMVQRLRTLGLTSNKSKTMCFPQVPIEYIPDFVRGHFDGDGSVFVSANHVVVSISCGSSLFTEKLVSTLSTALEHNVCYRKDTRRESVNFLVSFHSNRLAKRFYEWAYYDGCPCLHRKREVFKSI